MTGAICIVMKVNYTPFHKSRTRTRHPCISVSRFYLLPLSIEIHAGPSRWYRATSAPIGARTRHARSTLKFIPINGVEPLDRTAPFVAFSFELFAVRTSFFPETGLQSTKEGQSFPNPRDSCEKTRNLFLFFSLLRTITLPFVT